MREWHVGDVVSEKGSTWRYIIRAITPSGLVLCEDEHWRGQYYTFNENELVFREHIEAIQFGRHNKEAK